MAAMQLTRTHRILIGVVVAGAVVIAGIGFAGSYAAVRALALQKGFGSFSLVFPIGIDMGICVLLALDLLLTWIRIPFPLLRQTAWLLTAATIAFNGAAAWPDPLGVGMHAVIPILFVVTVEAARHAVGRIADITADRHMEGVRITRWLLSPLPTFKLWRRMKLWELRSYEQAVGMEQDRLIYQARLQARYGRAWRRKAPVEALMPLRLARIGVPLSQTAPEGLAAAGIDPLLLPPAAALAGRDEDADQPSGLPADQPGAQPGQPDGQTQLLAQLALLASAKGQPDAQGQAQLAEQLALLAGQANGPAQEQLPGQTAGQANGQGQFPSRLLGQPDGPAQEQLPGQTAGQANGQFPSRLLGQPDGPAQEQLPGQTAGQANGPAQERLPGQAAGQANGQAQGQLAEQLAAQAAGQAAAAAFAVDPTAMPAAHNSAWFAGPLAPQASYEGGYNPQYVEGLEPTPVMPPAGPGEDLPQQEAADADAEAEAGFDDVKFAEAAYEVFRAYLDEHSDFPTPEQVDIHLADRHGIEHPRSSSMIRKLMPGLKMRYQRELESEHIA
ncbi:DUF2637 domain-containing protein [Streptomyces sp. Mg1]|uniref:DUF2637 domain-containing protein n=1 Tax=Streptomyces sp. Mg1 TaxID=465541 RepID=UPI00017E9793|nr:DUF2637 domain-containing protein [Streptomyces sp. Mg1]AKL67293.1 hypothetical protein M444_20015 [Streptomyces sp. Mg1]EDX22372.1 hypothetical protein SSAG_02163 [Streptomyces sp. Mg1]